MISSFAYIMDAFMVKGIIYSDFSVFQWKIVIWRSFLISLAPDSHDL